MNEMNDIICIDDWASDDSAYEKGYYPEGTRDKTAYFSPDQVNQAALRPKHRYLFKQSRDRTPWQFWMEIIAYRVGKVMDVKVPPAFVGLSRMEQPGSRVWGALIEWFYTDEQEFVDGGRLIGPHIPGFNYKTGEQHNLQTILSLPDPTQGTKSTGAFAHTVSHWAAVLAFDAVIGNRDRHQENWGIIVGKDAQASSGGVRDSTWAPAYDNGTSLAYEQPEEHFGRFDDESYTRRHLARPKLACHHMKWDLRGSPRMNFYAFVGRFVDEHPEQRDGIIRRLRFTEGDLRDRLDGLAAIPVDGQARLTCRRLDFTLALLMQRRRLLLEALET